MRIVTPVIELRKGEIVRRASSWAPRCTLTWSCYQFEDAACGVCDSCRLRLQCVRRGRQPDPHSLWAPVLILRG